MTIQELADLILTQSRQVLKAKGYQSQIDAEGIEVTAGPKYTRIDRGPEGNRSGMLMINNETGEIFGIQGYGRVNKSRRYGTLGTVDQWYWGEYHPRKITTIESAPMKNSELGRYVCVAQGGCLHTERGGRVIQSDGVWVRSPDPDPLNPGSHLYSSAHRDCFEAWKAAQS